MRFVLAEAFVSVDLLQSLRIFAVDFTEGALGDSFGAEFFLGVIFSLLFFTFFILLDFSGHLVVICRLGTLQFGLFGFLLDKRIDFLQPVQNL